MVDLWGLGKRNSIIYSLTCTQVLLKAIGRNEGASIPCTLMVYVSVEFLALMRDGEDTLTLLM